MQHKWFWYLLHELNCGPTLSLTFDKVDVSLFTNISNLLVCDDQLKQILDASICKDSDQRCRIDWQRLRNATHDHVIKRKFPFFLLL